eukprot:1595908-Rhodomonas_salina.2
MALSGSVYGSMGPKSPGLTPLCPYGPDIRYRCTGGSKIKYKQVLFRPVCTLSCMSGCDVQYRRSERQYQSPLLSCELPRGSTLLRTPYDMSGTDPKRTAVPGKAERMKFKPAGEGADNYYNAH